jgi:ZIP family zinc transporter
VIEDITILAAAGMATALATGLGAVPVFLLGGRVAAWRPAMWGLAAGVMAVASIVGLLQPALEDGDTRAVAGGLLVGVAFLAVVRVLTDRHEQAVGRTDGRLTTVIVVFVVLLVHSLPEGMAMGTAYASDIEGLGLFVILAIALQNVPEGTATAIPMAAAGMSASRQFWAAVVTGLPQPVGAVGAYLLVEEVERLLPASFAFAAGAMLALIVVELLPSAYRDPTRWPSATAGILAGGAIMGLFAIVLGV